MVNFKVFIAKTAQGDIMVSGNYVSGNDPILVERVVLTEFDSGGNAIGSSTHRVNIAIDPSPGFSCLLISVPPSGSNVKTARATACFVVIDKAVQSPVLNL